jgi:hypothetical protein
MENHIYYKKRGREIEKKLVVVGTMGQKGWRKERKAVLKTIGMHNLKFITDASQFFFCNKVK